MKSPACGARQRRPDAGERVGVLLAAQPAVLDRRRQRRRVALELPAPAAQVGDLAAGPEAQRLAAALDHRPLAAGRRHARLVAAQRRPSASSSQQTRSTPSISASRAPTAVGLGPLALARQQVDVGGAAGRADRELGQLGPVVGGLQHRPLAAEQLGQRQAAVDRRSGRGRRRRISAWSARKSSSPPAASTSLREAVVGLGDRLDARLGPVAVGVVVVVGQREEQEVEEVLA